MPTFTMPLKQVAELNDGRIGLDDYPIFEESYREKLNDKIYDRYMNREIGMESDSLFIHAMKRRMNEIMPYYNQLYLSEQITIDPLNTVDVKTISDATIAASGTSHGDTIVDNDGTSNTSSTSNSSGTSTTDGTSDSTADNTSDSTSSSESRALQSNTPQTRLQSDADYADALSDTVSSNTANSTANDTRSGSTHEDGTTTDDTTSSDDTTTTMDETTTTDETTSTDRTESDEQTRRGFDLMGKSQAEMIMKLRESFLNIDRLIIEELNDLFMLVWATDDSPTGNYPSYYGGN